MTADTHSAKFILIFHTALGLTNQKHICQIGFSLAKHSWSKTSPNSYFAKLDPSAQGHFFQLSVIKMSPSEQGITESGNADQLPHNRNLSNSQKQPSEDRCRCSGVKIISIMEKKIWCEAFSGLSFLNYIQKSWRVISLLEDPPVCLIGGWVRFEISLTSTWISSLILFSDFR